jgi:putative transposase
MQYGNCQLMIAIIQAVGAPLNQASYAGLKSKARLSICAEDRSALLWQRKFWEHTIKDDNDLRRCVDYCYINPVKHGLVKLVKDWPYSSFYRDVKRGIYPANWAVIHIATTDNEFVKPSLNF